MAGLGREEYDMRMNLTEKTLEVKRAFEGRALTIDVASIELPNGRRSVREICATAARP